MGWFPYWGTYPGFPWFMLFFPLMFFAMMFLFCMSSHRGWFACCVNRRSPHELEAELAALRKEIEELKKK
jgi:hypothetical protein